MNCLALEQGGEALVVDCGVTFDDRGLGVDVVHPDFAALDGAARRGRLRHARSRGPHRRDPVPAPAVRRAGLRAARTRSGLVRERAAEHEVLAHVRPARGRAARARARRAVRGRAHPRDALDRRRDGAGHPDATRGSCVHTGDFKFDDAPSGRRDVRRRALRGAGARRGAPAAAATRRTSTRRGPTGSEEGVGQALDAIVGAAPAARSSWRCSRRTCTGCGCSGTSRDGTGASSCRSGAA